jgi:hypothetical protein
MSDVILIGTFNETTRLDVPTVAKNLLNWLGPVAVAVLTQKRDTKLPAKWAKGTVTPRPEAITRMREAHRLFAAIEQEESVDVARAWFVGTNPRLGDEAPLIVIREGRYKEAALAAKAFLEDSYNG